MPDEKKKSYGGMAVVEGVMMRSPSYYSVACRAPNGKIFVKTEPVEKTWIGRQKWLLKPFLRGTFALLDTMGLGMRAMRIAGDVQLDAKFQPEEGETVHPEKQKDKPPSRMQIAYEKNQPFWDKLILGVTLVLSLVIGFLIFNVFPNFAGQYISEFGKTIGIEPKGNERGMFTTVLVESIKLVMFIGYVALIRRYPAILEVFRFHGAEHQAINAMEAGVELTPQNCLRQTRLHPRCGTNFALLVFIVSFLLFPFVPRDLIVPADSASWLIAITRLPVEIALLPLVAGISYEIIRLAGKFKNERWVNIVLWPGLKTQLITTAEPDARHAEVAIAALEAAVLAEETGELTNSDDYVPVSLRGSEEPAAPNDQVERAAQ
jgi:uncharacterized protein YqhQ